MDMIRHLILERLYEWSKLPYRWLIKREEPWNITAPVLCTYPEDSLGFHLGCFLLQHHFESEPQLENHDVYHVLTKSGITVPEEIAMQYYLLGNGKRSLYLFGVLAIGTFLFPDYFLQFISAYKKGKQAHSFYHLNFLKLLDQPISKLTSIFKISHV